MTVDDETIRTLRELHTELKLDEEVIRSKGTCSDLSVLPLTRLLTTWNRKIGRRLTSGHLVLTCMRGSWSSKRDLPADFGGPRGGRRLAAGETQTTAAGLETR